MKQAKYILTLLLIALPLAAMGQKPKNTVDFAAESLPTDLLEYLNKATSEKSVQKDNAKAVEAFTAAYSSLDGTLQQRLTDLYIYAVGVKIKAVPELVDFTRAFTAYAEAGNAANLEGWVASLETYRKKNSKVKYVNEFVAWSQLLLSDRVKDLFHDLREQYDVIIVDSAPVAMVSDSFALDKYSNATVYVTRANYAHRNHIKFMNRIAASKQLKNMCVVLNDTKPSGDNTYGYGYGKKDDE